MSELIDEVMGRISYDHDCWRWNGGHDQDGYGRFRRRGMKQAGIHRIVYESLVGPIPPGMHIDHLCRNPGCCNPLHLEAVAPKENIKRGSMAQKRAGKTHCPKGHAYVEHARIQTWTDSDGVVRQGRTCRICDKECWARFKAKTRLARSQ